MSNVPNVRAFVKIKNHTDKISENVLFPREDYQAMEGPIKVEGL